MTSMTAPIPLIAGRTGGHRPSRSKMMREAHPIEAAERKRESAQHQEKERRQYLAPGASPGISALSSVSTVFLDGCALPGLHSQPLIGATDSVGSFAPTGLDLKNNMFPGLTPGAWSCRRSAAQ